MPIPPLTKDKTLPDGIHETHIEELMFRFCFTEERESSLGEIRRLIVRIKRIGLFDTIYIGGSLPTALDIPIGATPIAFEKQKVSLLDLERFESFIDLEKDDFPDLRFFFRFPPFVSNLHDIFSKPPPLPPSCMNQIRPKRIGYLKLKI